MADRLAPVDPWSAYIFPPPSAPLLAFPRPPDPAATNIIDVQLASLKRRLDELTPGYQQAMREQRAAEERRQQQARQAEAETIRKVQKRCAELRAKRFDELTVGDYGDLGGCGLQAPAMR